MLLKVKPQDGAYMFVNLQTFNNSQVKAHSMLSMSTYSLYLKTAETLPLAYVTKL